jgi:hypothetical protein
MRMWACIFRVWNPETNKQGRIIIKISNKNILVYSENFKNGNQMDSEFSSFAIFSEDSFLGETSTICG